MTPTIVSALMVEGSSNFVANTAQLAALPASNIAAYLAAGKSSGFFNQVSWASVSAIAAVDTFGGYVVRSTIDTSRAWLRQTDILWPEMFGAVGDNVTNDVAAFRLVFAMAKATGLPIFLSASNYRWTLTATEVWDFTSVYATGLEMRGSGPGLSNVNISVSGFAVGQTAWRVQSTADWYRLGMSNFSIQSAFDGCLFEVGQAGFADPLNIAEFSRVEVKNSFAGGTQTEAWRLNYVVNSNFIGCIGNCYADGLGANYGTALRSRQASFNTFTNGSFGNAAYGVRFTDSISYGNVFLGCDHENVSYCVANNSSGALRNTWIGGTMSLWTSYALQSTNSDATGSTVFKNVNFNNGGGPATIVDTSSFQGITVQDGLTVATPGVPASGATISNTTGKTVSVRVGGGAYTVVTIGGFSMAKASNSDWTSWILPAGSTIAITYSSAPSWSWLAPNF